MRRLKPTHGLKSFSWTCCGLVLSFGLTTLNLLLCGFDSSDVSDGHSHRMLPCPSGTDSVSYSPLPDAYSDTGGSRCLRLSESFRALSGLVK